MDDNTRLILANAVTAENWEDCEKATGDINALREEFRKRLYPQQANQAGPRTIMPKSPRQKLTEESVRDR